MRYKKQFKRLDFNDNNCFGFDEVLSMLTERENVFGTEHSKAMIESLNTNKNGDVELDGNEFTS